MVAGSFNLEGGGERKRDRERDDRWKKKNKKTRQINS